MPSIYNKSVVLAHTLSLKAKARFVLRNPPCGK